MKLTSLILTLSSLSLTAFGQTAAAGSPRLVCLFLDFSSMSPQDQLKAQESAIQFVEQQAAPSDLVEIATYTSRLSVVQDFTADHDSLLTALKNIVPGDTASASGDLGGRLQAIQDAAASLSRFPAKKALVYFSSGISVKDNDNSELSATVNALSRANVAVWAIDTAKSGAQ